MRLKLETLTDADLLLFKAKRDILPESLTRRQLISVYSIIVDFEDEHQFNNILAHEGVFALGLTRGEKFSLEFSLRYRTKDTDSFTSNKIVIREGYYRKREICDKLTEYFLRRFPNEA